MERRVVINTVYTVNPLGHSRKLTTWFKGMSGNIRRNVCARPDLPKFIKLSKEVFCIKGLFMNTFFWNGLV